jgi:hypothetical protein
MSVGFWTCRQQYKQQYTVDQKKTLQPLRQLIFLNSAFYKEFHFIASFGIFIALSCMICTLVAEQSKSYIKVETTLRLKSFL